MKGLATVYAIKDELIQKIKAGLSAEAFKHIIDTANEMVEKAPELEPSNANDIDNLYTLVALFFAAINSNNPDVKILDLIGDLWRAERAKNGSVTLSPGVEDNIRCELGTWHEFGDLTNINEKVAKLTWFCHFIIPYCGIGYAAETDIDSDISLAVYYSFVVKATYFLRKMYLEFTGGRSGWVGMYSTAINVNKAFVLEFIDKIIDGHIDGFSPQLRSVFLDAIKTHTEWREAWQANRVSDTQEESAEDEASDTQGGSVEDEVSDEQEESSENEASDTQEESAEENDFPEQLKALICRYEVKCQLEKLEDCAMASSQDPSPLVTTFTRLYLDPNCYDTDMFDLVLQWFERHVQSAVQQAQAVYSKQCEQQAAKKFEEWMRAAEQVNGPPDLVDATIESLITTIESTAETWLGETPLQDYRFLLPLIKQMRLLTHQQLPTPEIAQQRWQAFSARVIEGNGDELNESPLMAYEPHAHKYALFRTVDGKKKFLFAEDTSSFTLPAISKGMDQRAAEHRAVQQAPSTTAVNAAMYTPPDAANNDAASPGPSADPSLTPSSLQLTNGGDTA